MDFVLEKDTGFTVQLGFISMLYLLTQVKLNQRRFKAKFKLQPVIVSSASAVPRIHSSSVKYELYICAVTPS